MDRSLNPSEILRNAGIVAGPDESRSTAELADDFLNGQLVEGAERRARTVQSIARISLPLIEQSTKPDQPPVLPAE